MSPAKRGGGTRARWKSAGRGDYLTDAELDHVRRLVWMGRKLPGDLAAKLLADRDEWCRRCLGTLAERYRKARGIPLSGWVPPAEPDP